MRVKIYFAAGIFIALSLIKILLGGHGDDINDRVRNLVGVNAETIETIGRELADKGIAGEIREVLNFSGRRLKPAGNTYSDGYTDNVIHPVQTSPELLILNLDLSFWKNRRQAERKTEQAEPAKSEEPAAVTAFLNEQAQYKGYEIPENVRTDMPELPFEYLCPVDGIDSSGFGYRLHPIQNEVKFHFGTDFAANSGDTVNAFADGEVVSACYSDSYGNYVIIDHGGGFETLYAHLSSFGVSAGDKVSMGQSIARVGQTGNATGPHLHFELHMNDSYLNPEYYI